MCRDEARVAMGSLALGDIIGEEVGEGVLAVSEVSADSPGLGAAVGCALTTGAERRLATVVQSAVARGSGCGGLSVARGCRLGRPQGGYCRQLEPRRGYSRGGGRWGGRRAVLSGRGRGGSEGRGGYEGLVVIAIEVGDVGGALIWKS